MDKKKGKLKRGMGILLAVAMLFNTLPISGFAVSASEKQETGLCEHHAEHTAECGYTEAQPCTHEHSDECYEIVTECVHTHTDECYPEMGETDESTEEGEGSATPSDAESREPVNCSHQCSEESGCISRTLDCPHGHDESCGYAEAHECGYVCEICNSTEPENAGDNAKGTDIDTVETKSTEPEDTGLCAHHQEHTGDCGYGEDSPCTYDCPLCPIEDLIAALPWTVTEDNAEEVRAQFDAILDLYRGLTEDEQGQIDLSLCRELQAALDVANEPVTAATGDVTLTTSNKTVTFTEDECGNNCQGHIITQNVQSGQLGGATIIVESGTHNVTFSGLNLTSAKVGVMPGATMNLTLTGTNTIQGNDSGIYVPESATLVICGDGSLNVSASSYAAGIGGAFVDPSDPSGYTLGNRNCGTVVINDGNITATGGSYSAGIGGAEADFDTKIPGNGGNITINGGNVTAIGGGDDWYGGAGIGGSTYNGKSGSGGTLTINGGNVTLTAGHSSAYGFGRGSGTNNVNAGILTLADASYLTLTSGTTLDPKGAYSINGDPTEDMIVVPENLVYTGNPLDVSGIRIDDSKTGTAEYFGQTFKVSASADGWDYTISPEEVKEAGEYTVTFTKGDKSISTTFTVAACPHTGLVYKPQADNKHGGTCPDCGTEVSEEHTWEDGVCSVCNLKAVAQVEIDNATAYYDTIGDAWNVVEGKTASITLLANVTAEGIHGVDLGENIIFNGGNFTYTSEYGVLSVGGDGKLTINSGTFIATQGTALNAVTGSIVTLNGGTFTGGSGGAAVACPNDPVSVFLSQGYAYYQNGQPLEMSDQKYLEGSVTVQECEHTGVSSSPNNNGTHSLKCPYCGYTGTPENCSYTFNGNVGTCPDCKDTLTVSVTGTENLIYDGNAKTLDVAVKRGEQVLTANTDYTVAYANNTTAGTDTASVAVTIGSNQGTYTEMFSISAATPTITWSSDTQELTYTGSEAKITAPTVTLVNNEQFNGAINYSYTGTTSGTGLPINAGTYTIKASVAANGNYIAADSTNTLTLTIGKADGTLTVPETSISKNFGDGEFSLNCSTNGDGKISYASSDENVALVSADGNVLIKGAGETIITVSLAEGTNHTGGAEATVTVTVAKAAAPAIINETRNYTYLSGSNGAVTIDVAGKLPKDRGETTYTFTTTDEKGILSDVSVDNNGNLYLTVLGNKSEGDTASITVTAEMANYENAAYTVNIELVAKKVVEPQAGSSVSIKGSNILTYGQTLSDLTLDSVIFVEQGTSTKVEGTLAWKDGSIVPAVGTAAAEWTFTPTNATEYAELTGMVAITVVKATPEVEAPTADAVTYSPSGTLHNVGLTGGSATWIEGGNTVTVEGTWSWKDASAVPSVGNSGYTAVFTPKDTANYNTVECTVAVPVEKAVPHIAVPPTAAQITYGDALDASVLTGGTAQYSGSDSTAVAGSFAWKDGTIKPAVSDSGSTEYAVVFTPADSTNYSSVETKITLTIEKAENAPNTPSAAMNVSRKCEKVSDVELPTDWQWQDADKDTALEIGVPVTATAVYVGADKDNYKNVAVAVAITKLNCDHKNTELRNVVAATCQKKGYSGDTYCLDCEELLAKGSETGLADHSGGTATCISGKICVVCGAEYSGKNSGNHTHTEIRGAVGATCTADGYTGDAYCTGCKAKTGTGTVIHATGHDWHITSEEAATTTSEGRRVYTCSKCRQTREESIPKLPQPSHTHSYSARETKAATCTENGVITYSCSCGDSYTQNTAALGHDYRSRVTQEPTTEKAGVRTYTCTRCGSTYTESIPKLPEDAHTHSYKGSVTKKATCTETGIRTYTCACGDSYTRTIPAQGHNYTHKVTTEPTMEKAGVRTYTCTRCGNSYTESIPKLPSEDHKHDYSVTVVKEVACAEAGVKRYACACGDSYTESIPALGHSYISKVTQEPTVSAEGVMTYTCTRCGDSYTKPIGRLADTPSGPGSRPESGKPFIKDESGKEGWTVIKEETDKAGDGSTVTVDMNGSTVVPGDVLGHIRGRDVTVVFDMGDGIAWSVNGKSVKGDEISDIDFSVQKDTEKIPEDKVGSIAGERYSIQVSLAHEGEFGFTAVLSINLGKENAGLYARLFYYNESTGELEIAARAERIADDGSVSLAFTHASEYVIVVGDEADGGNVSSDAPAGTPESGDAGGSDQSPQTGQPWRPWWIVVVGALVIIIGIGAFFVVRKKKEEKRG